MDQGQIPADNSNQQGSNSSQPQASQGQTASSAQASAQQKLLQLQNTNIDEQTQQMLNQPLSHPEGLDEKDQLFLNMLLDKIERKAIDLYRPSSLLNSTVYEKLSPEAQAQADTDAFQLLATIRTIHNLCKAGYRDTYQVENLTHSIRLTKERLEGLGGDIFII